MFVEKNKLISIVLPVHNEARWLSSCVDSLMCQEYKNIEIIIIDDASIDNSFQIAKQLQQKYGSSSVIVHHFEKTMGEGASRTKGIELSHGEIIVETDADALFPSTFISRSLEYFDQYKTDGLSIGELKVHPDLKGPIANYWRAKRRASFELRRDGKKGGVIGMYIFYRSVAETLSGYRSTIPSGTDFDFAMRAKKAGFTTEWAQDVFFYHADPSSLSIFLKRLYNAARYSAPVHRYWGVWLSWLGRLKELLHFGLFVALFLVGSVGFLIPSFFIAWAVLFFVEGIVPLWLHTETKQILRICVRERYCNTLFLLPIITMLRLRANNFGKIYAILFFKKVSKAVTFDV